MDLDLPGMNGFEGTKRVREIAPATRVIILFFRNAAIIPHFPPVSLERGDELFGPKPRILGWHPMLAFCTFAAATEVGS